MTMHDIVGRISGQPSALQVQGRAEEIARNERLAVEFQDRVGRVAEDNGMVKGIGCLEPGTVVEVGPVVDLSASQSGILSKQYTLIADRLATLDSLVTASALQSERLDLVEAENRALRAMCDDLAKENAEINALITFMRSPDMIQDRKHQASGLLELGEESDLDLDY